MSEKDREGWKKLLSGGLAWFVKRKRRKPVSTRYPVPGGGGMSSVSEALAEPPSFSAPVPRLPPVAASEFAQNLSECCQVRQDAASNIQLRRRGSRYKASQTSSGFGDRRRPSSTQLNNQTIVMRGSNCNT